MIVTAEVTTPDRRQLGIIVNPKKFAEAIQVA